jgi:2-methylisocitrate lyase-like PEP mutase family enzyme
MAKGTGDEAKKKRLKFRRLLKPGKFTPMPGGFSPFYAKIAQEVGFETFFLPGSQLSHFLYGVPDNGIIGMRDLVDHCRHMAAHTDIPILVDADTGYGNAVNVHFAVQEIIRSGVAALQIEDQEAPKKSGTLAGRRLISVDEAVGKIRAAVAARDEIDPSFVICARCDGIGAEGSDFDDTLKRCIAYVKEGGADLIWLNSVQSLAQCRRAAKEIPAPVLVIWGGETAPPSWAQFAKTGINIALYPVIAATSGLQASWEVLSDFRARGQDAINDWERRVAKNPYGRPDIKKIIGYDKIVQIEKKFLPTSSQRDYKATWGHKTHYVESAAEKSPVTVKAKPKAKAKAKKR